MGICMFLLRVVSLTIAMHYKTDITITLCAFAWGMSEFIPAYFNDNTAH